MEKSSVKGDSMEKPKRFQTPSLDGDEEFVEEEENDDDDEEEEEEEEPVTLGFAEKPKNRWSLLRQVFPSKAGGVPAWLDPVNLPTGKSCLCDFCEEPLQFLLQVYAPIEEKESTYHRALFVFMCPKMSCLLRDQHEQWKRSPDKSSRSVKVFRCQLPQSNPFYSSELPKKNGTDKPSGLGVELCNWCGTWKGDKFCSSCKRAKYCSKKHQAMHWHSGHQTVCKQWSLSSQFPDSSSHKNGSTSTEISKVASNTLWLEHEIVIDDESAYDDDDEETDDPARALVSKNRSDDAVNSLLDSFEGDSDRKCFASFQQRVAKAPDQVLRYCRNSNAKPLWPLSSGQPSKADIPNCCHCGGPLDFEFQVLPQLLYFFGVENNADSLDWATIVVYTCRASCEGSLVYKEEFPWVQLYSPSAT